MNEENEAAGAVNTDGQDREVRSNPQAVYNAAGYLVNGCSWCPSGFGFAVALAHCRVCGSGVCGFHVAFDLCPRCAVPQTAGELRSLYFSEPDPYLEERLLDAREEYERRRQETDDGQALVGETDEF